MKVKITGAVLRAALFWQVAERVAWWSDTAADNPVRVVNGIEEPGSNRTCGRGWGCAARLGPGLAP
jgi:hypothetical protein